MIYDITLTRVAIYIFFKWAITSASENVEVLESSCIADGIVK